MGPNGTRADARDHVAERAAPAHATRSSPQLVGTFANDAFWDDYRSGHAASDACFRNAAEAIPPDTTIVVDVGAGDGSFARVMIDTRSDVGAVISVDASLIAVRRAPGMRVVASIDALPFRNGAVPTVTCLEVLEHVPDAILRDAPSEMARVAHSRIVVTVPNEERLAHSNVECARCHCRYNRHGHIRSFHASTLSTLGNTVGRARVTAIGPRRPSYPASLRRWAERLRLVSSLDGSTCPQCGFVRPLPAPSGTSSDIRRRHYRTVRRLVPRLGPQLWLLVTIDTQ